MKEKRFKTKVKATDSSQITDQTIGEIIEAKIEFVVEKTRNEAPYINWLSKYSLVWGGKLFGSLEYDNPLRVGFVAVTIIKIVGINFLIFQEGCLLNLNKKGWKNFME